MLDKKVLVNNESLYGVVAFDNWLLNTDRDNEGNNMFQLLDDDKIQYWMVDFGHCFLHNNWTAIELEGKRKQEELVNMLGYVKERITKFDDFCPWFDAIEKFDDREIDYIVNAIPSSWPLSKTEKQTLLNVIKDRKPFSRKNITAHREKFNLGS